MPTPNPQQLKPNELIRLINSTPLGAVLDERKLQRHKLRAGYLIGDDQLNFYRYAAWLADQRHGPKPSEAVAVSPDDKTSGPPNGKQPGEEAARRRGVLAHQPVCRRCFDLDAKRDPLRGDGKISEFVTLWRYGDTILCPYFGRVPVRSVPKECPYFAQHAAALAAWEAAVTNEELQMGSAQ